ncbi:MAG: aminopeptidase P family protein [Chitinophagaceae bacterium]|nr:aminopeptidase P family protein [Chitinophagaceae bacterium]
MKYQAIDKKLFIDNRSKFVKQLQGNSIAIINSNTELPENGDVHIKFKQNSSLFWLTGVIQEKTMLILFPQNIEKNFTEVLVILRPNEHLEKWEGHKLTPTEASNLSGIKTVIFLDQLDALLQSWMHHCENVYLNTNENDRMDGTLPRLDLNFINTLKSKYPLHNYKRAAPIFKELRAIKSSAEIALLQEAVNITHKAFERVCKFIKPNVWEYEIEAEITHEFLKNRATRHAYGCILASGDNARILHYVENNQQCKNGDLILMDFGAEYANYCADLTRTIPVNGKFSKRQKEVYDACLAVHNYAKKILKPGKTWLEITALAEKEMENQLVKIGLLTKNDIKNQDPANPALKKYFYHGLGHHLGIDVHDLGTRNTPIKTGMVFTIEPGIYIQEEKMGVRIENDVWVSKTGNIDLFKKIPITTDEIEKVMKK